MIRNKTIWGKKPVSAPEEVSEINGATQFAFTGNLLLPGVLQKSIRQVKTESEQTLDDLTDL